MAVRKGLGRGLDLLIPKDESMPKKSTGKNKDTQEAAENQILTLSIHDVEPNRNQPRKQFDEDAIEELADSIKQYGVIQPLIVQKKDKYYEIIAGERRWRACKKAGLKEVPVIIKNYDEKETLKISLIENLQREDLDPVEEAAGIRELMLRCDLTQEQAARKLGKSRSALANSLRLLNLPENVLELLKSGFLNMGHAKVILGLPTPELQEQAAQIVADNQLNVRQTEALCKKLAKPPKEAKEPEPRGTLPVEVEESLKQALGSEVNVAYHGGKGKLTVHFYSDEQLRAFANLLGQYQTEE
mgnify:CR=1 FL=1